MSSLTLNDILEGHVPLTSNRESMAAIAGARESRLLAVVLSPDVRLGSDLASPLMEVLDTLPEGGGLDLFVDALGGASAETWRVVSMLRERFDRYTAIVPFAASPGATQVALGANELMMGEGSSLSPIEPPRLRRLETAEGERVPVSAYDVYHYANFLRRTLGPDAATASSPALAQLWTRLDPLVVGATERAHQTQLETTRRCLATHKQSEETIEQVISELDGRSHRFPITRRDCEARLGLSVLKPSRDLWADVWSLYEYYERMFELSGDLMLGDQRYSVDYEGFIDAVDERRVLIRVTRLDERGHAVSDRQVIRRWVRPKGREVKVDEELEL